MDALLEGDAAPRLVARLAGGGDGAPPPDLGPGRGVVGGDDAGVRAAPRHAAPPRDDLAAGDDGARRVPGGVRPVVEDRGLPREATGHGVEGEYVVVDAGVDDVPAEDGDVAVGGQAAHVLLDVVWGLAAVLPHEVAGGRVDGLDDVARVRHVEDAVVGERRALLAARGEAARPHHPQRADVAAVDLVEGAVAPAVRRPPPRQPVGRRGVLEHRVGDGNERRGGLGLRTGGGGRQQRRQGRRHEQNASHVETRRVHVSLRSEVPLPARL